MIERREWRWAAVFALGVMAFTSVPYVVAAAAQTEAWYFGGFLLAVEDGNSYIAKMAQGARGAWLFTLPYSSEPQRGVLMFAFHLLLGRLAGSDHTVLVLVYHAARVAGGIGLLLVAYAFLAHFLPEVRQRRLGLVLVALGGGLGWLLTLLGRGQWLGSLPVDFISPEAFSFLVLYALPHLAVARALLLLGLLFHLRERPLMAGLALFGASLIQPLYVLVAGLLIGLDVLIGWRLGFWPKSALPRRLAGALLTGVLSAPMVLYTVYMFNVDPVLQQWNAQNQLPSPHPLQYVLAFGMLALPAVPGWRALWRACPRLAAFAGAWVVLAPVLLYVPIPTQRRLIEGVQLPLVALAVLGLTAALPRWRPWLVPGALALSLPTALLLWLGGLAVARVPAEPIFHPADRIAAFAWLANHARPGQVALAAYETGNALPAYTPAVAYIGHGPETVFLAEKQPRVAAFYRPETPSAEREQLLADGRIDFVLFGPHERALGDFDPATADYLQWRFESGSYAVYEVVP